MVDLHTHLLPGVDDGAETIERAVEVLRRFASEGVTAVCCTPHLLASEFAVAPLDDLEQLLGELSAVAPQVPRLHLGCEIMLDVPNADFSDPRLRLAATRYALVEFGRMVEEEASADALASLAARGLVPVLAHPERYAICSTDVARRWQEAGAILQVDATTLMAQTGRGARARSLVEAGCAAILASDNHGDGRSLAAAVQWLEARGGREQARLLATRNPAAILDDRAVAEVPPLKIRRSWYSRLKNLVMGETEA